MEHTQQSAAHDPFDEIILRDELRELRKKIPDQPGLNPITRVAFELSRKLDSGQISFDELKTLAGRLMDKACVYRARRLRKRMGYVDHETTLKEFAEAVSASIGGDAGTEAAFAAFDERWSRARSGIVFTAHPTFGSSDAVSRRIIDIATSDTEDEQWEIGVPHRPDEGISLNYEHKRAQASINNLRDAYLDLLNTFFSVSAKTFGDRAYKLKPRLASIASWVGYDLDGRTDIKWDFSFRLRLKEKRAALNDIRERFLILKHKLGESPEIQRVARQVTGKLDLAIAAVDEQILGLENLAAGEPGWDLAKASNIVSRSDGYNLTSTEPITELFDQLIDLIEQTQMKRAVAALSGLTVATGLGNSHIHVRINAVQLNNAFRSFVHAPWTRDLGERQATARIVDMIKNAKPESVNFETLDLETTTAIRQFALIAQMKKHVDKETPVRFLIAECESPATILIAVYFARLFDVADIVDISPLFETPLGLETGVRMMEALLEQEAYRDYVKGRGRLCIQTGFSDAGRFIGQIAATLAIERVHHGLAEAVAKSNMPGVETLIFSTFGESMGRGTHPGDLNRRLRYVLSDESRRRFARKGLLLKHETSFQGGDGYLWFANKQFSARGLATIILDGEDPQLDVHDPFYDDNNLTLDFLLRLRAYQQNLFAHPGYRALLGAFGPNLLFKTGSRAVKRQSDSGNVADRGDPARMRAIPNNAILQQFGYVANVVAGLGAAVGSERERFIDLARKSARLRPLIEMIARGKTLSSLNAVDANATVFDPGFWASRAAWAREPHLASAFRQLASHLLEDKRADAISGLAHNLRLDAIDLHSLLEEIGVEGGKIPDDVRLELDLLQAIRLALIMRVFILAARLPRFSTRNDLSHQQMFTWALGMEIPEVISLMHIAFPKRHEGSSSRSYDEVATYRPQGIDDYARIETDILEPMEQAYEYIREIGTGITHHFGAFG